MDSARSCVCVFTFVHGLPGRRHRERRLLRLRRGQELHEPLEGPANLMRTLRNNQKRGVVLDYECCLAQVSDDPSFEGAGHHA